MCVLDVLFVDIVLDVFDDCFVLDVSNVSVSL